MKKLIAKRDCILGCGWDEDSVHHYVCCGTYWSFVADVRPRGLGLPHVKRCKENALLISDDLAKEDVIRLAVGLYALYRTVNTIRFAKSDGDPHCPARLLKLFSQRATDHCGCQRLLSYGG